MRTLITKTLALGSMVLLVLSACKKDGQLVSVGATPNTTAVLSASTTTPALVKANLTNNAITFTTTTPTYGYSAVVTSVLQFDTKGDNFATPKKEVTLTGLSQAYTVQELNNILLAMNLPTGTAAQVEVRVKSSLSPTVGISYSNVLTITATPFALISYVYVPGAYQNTDVAKQWQPTTADSLVSPTGNGVYTGWVYFFAGGKFKVTPAKNWNASYGDAGSGKISLTGSDITAPGTGLYLVTVDLNANTITTASADHTWSVIGDGAKDWSTDINMTFNQNANAYQVTTALVASGQIKFRADHDWALSLGNVTPVTGVLTSNNGSNISIPSNGNYLISLSYGNPLAPSYTLVKQ